MNVSASREKKTRGQQDEQILQQREAMKRQQEQEERRSMTLYKVVAVVCVALALFMVVWNTGMLQKNATAVTVGDREYSVTEVQYHFNSTTQGLYDYYYQYFGFAPFNYNSSLKAQTYDSETGESWYDYLMDQTMQSLELFTAVKDRIDAEGYTMSAEAKQVLDTVLSNLDEAWKQSGYKNADEYLQALYGPYMDQATFTQLYTEGQLITDYLNKVQSDFVYDDAALKAYYEKNADKLDTFTLSQLTVQARVELTDADGKTIEMTDEEKAEKLEEAKAEAEKLANEIAERLKAGEDIEKVAQEYEQVSDTAIISDSTLGSTLTSMPYSGWLFDSARKAGDVTVAGQESGSTGYYYYIPRFEGRELDLGNTADVRHILVAAEQDKDAEQPTQAQYDAAKAEAEKLLGEWKAGAATEESFAALAQEHSADTGSAANGGLITNIHAASGYVATFADWALDSHKAGDTGIVQNTGSSTKGWHIMYYVASGAPAWEQTAENTLRSEDYAAWETAAMEDYEAVEGGMGMKFIQG